MTNWVTLEKTTIEQDYDIMHPWTDLSFDQVLELIKDTQTLYPQYTKFRWKHCYESFRYGAINYWWELQGC